MDKIFDPKKFESMISKKWKDKKFFSQHDWNKEPFAILLPPPNVTGKLHIGHALDTYLQDSVIRYKKLQGYDVFYIAGMDHAGIATQTKVEATLIKEEHKNRLDYGKEKFVKKIWEWKERFSNTIRQQWATLGLALDYDNERFTLDDLSNNAVNKVFIEFYNKGIIYKDTKPIHWDPVLLTAVSNIEVINIPTEQIMYFIEMPILNSKETITISTVRPETMLSDVAIVYNPKDKRYSHLKDQKVIHPLTNKIIPFIADEYIDPKFGTGLMKLSAHAEVDIEIIKKNSLEIHETIDKTGKINETNSPFHGLSREEARIKIIEFLKQKKLVVKEEKTISNVGHSERSNAIIETLVMPQWFVKMEPLSKKVLEHLKSKEAIKFFPKRFINLLRKWVENAHDWNISRQIWWGHRIPAWYKDEQTKVQIESPGKGWIQDNDVLDTWFSSGIAPFSFLGWPKDDTKLKRYYPNSLLVTGFDIIFFWVVRMYFFGLYFQKDKPFRELLIHGLVRDSLGRKMSKSLNNGVDPTEVIGQYGSDALRWSLIMNSTPGYDLKYTNEKVQSAWSLINKLWNISRYIVSLEDDNIKISSKYDNWIQSKVINLQKDIDKAMKKYEFTIINSKISKFLYNDFSSWYIEFLKTNPNKKQALSILKQVLLILHPFLPFVTDYLFFEIFEEELLDNILTKTSINKFKNTKSLNEIDTTIEVISAIRKYRDEKNISKKDIIKYDIDFSLSDDSIEVIQKLANCVKKENRDALIQLGNGNLYIELDEFQIQEDVLRLKQEIEKMKFEINRSKNILSNQNFLLKAPKEKVELEKTKLLNYQEKLQKYQIELEEKCKSR